MPNPSRPAVFKRQRGSILVEALLSVVILSVSLSAIIQAMTSSLRASAYSSDYTIAVLLAENKMASLLRDNKASVADGEEGLFPEPFERYQYTIETSLLNEEGYDNLKQVELKVFWSSGKKKNNITVHSYVSEAEE